MKKYKQMTLEQRYELQGFIQSGVDKARIANLLGLHPATVYRELKRNANQCSKGYSAGLAARKCAQRHRSKRKSVKFSRQLRQSIEKLLKRDYSPEQVVGSLKRQGQACVSVERIYQHIWQDKKQGGKLYTHLRHQGKRYRKRGALKDSRGLITNRTDIDQRPAIVEKKARLGDLEVDTVIGKNHKGALVTINCRATGVLKMRLVKSRQAEEVASAIISSLQDWLPWLNTITADNGKEFALHQQIAEQLNIAFYFAKPYHSWQRGANENLNGLIRQYFPKGSNFSTLTQQQVEQVEAKLNQRPRKRYNFKSPEEMMAKLINQKPSFALIS